MRVSRPMLNHRWPLASSARPVASPASLWPCGTCVCRCHGDDGWPPRAEASTNLLFGGAAWRQARDNPTQARSAPQPRQAQKTHWQVQCIVRPVLCSRSKLTWLFGSMAAGQGQPASFDFAQPQHANLPCTRRRIGSTRLAGFLAFLVPLPAVPYCANICSSPPMCVAWLKSSGGERDWLGFGRLGKCQITSPTLYGAASSQPRY